MKLNDPFGRVSNRNQQNYRMLRERLQQAGVRDAAGVSVFIRNMSVTAAKVWLIFCAVCIGLAVFLPQLQTVLLAINVLVLLWLAVVYFKTRMHLNRYLREECGEDQIERQTSGGKPG
mgnify:CR=1 FL=1